ncbi:MAG: DNA polymerase III subunit beta [Spirochaetia bacterium]|nr:DNA polymerase III subunit beta [Spirochaetia bacterium]
MKIKTKKSEIMEPLQIAQYFISTGSTLPLLSNILFEADADFLYMSATDMDISVRIKCKVDKVETQGKTTISKKIIPLIKEAPEGDIRIDTDKSDNTKVTFGKSSYKINGLPAEDFPALSLDEKKLDTVKMPQKLLKEIISKIYYAALKDTTKRNLNGVFFKFEGNKIEAVATDAHRLAYYKTEIKTGVKSKFDYIIPLKTINEIVKVLSDDETKEITINFYDKVVEFQLENMEIVSRIIDENYPNYNQVIPKEFTAEASVSKDDLSSAIRRASTITSDKSKIISIRIEKNKLYINASAQDEGEAFEEIDAKYDGEPIEVSYNAVYVMDVLKVIEADTIEIKLISSMNPGIIKGKGNDDFLYVVMPIRK